VARSPLKTGAPAFASILLLIFHSQRTKPIGALAFTDHYIVLYFLILDQHVGFSIENHKLESLSLRWCSGPVQVAPGKGFGIFSALSGTASSPGLTPDVVWPSAPKAEKITQKGMTSLQ
jgi:hypothetical protein